ALAGDDGRSNGFVVTAQVSTAGASETAAWVLRLEADGTIAWQKRFEGFQLLPGFQLEANSAVTLQASGDGGFLIGGSTGRANDSLSPVARVMKLDAGGTIEWLSQPLGLGPIAAIEETPEGGYLAAGNRDGHSATVARVHSGVVQWNYEY